MRIVSVRMITFPRPYGSHELDPLPPSGGRHGDRTAYLKAWRQRNAERVRGYTQAQNGRRKALRKSHQM